MMVGPTSSLSRSVLFGAVLATGGLLAMPFTAAASPGDNASTGKKLVVAVVDLAPFAIADPDGSWSGIGMDLWRDVAADLDLDWEARKVGQVEVHTLLRDGVVDLAIGALAISSRGEGAHDFSHAYLSTGLGFVERSQRTLSWSAAVGAFGNTDILKTAGIIAFAVTFVGVLIAVLERAHNVDRFGGPLPRGIATGMWWAAAAMTTLGDGDATPTTRYGRLVAFVWMFVGVTAVAYFTATISALLTISSLHGTVRHSSDLYRLRVGVLADGAAAEFLEDRGVACTTFATTEEALTGLAEHRVDAVLGPLPVLRHAVSRDWQGILQPSPIVLEHISYAIGFPAGSPLLEPVNRTLLHIIEEERWQDLERRYMGHHG